MSDQSEETDVDAIEVLLRRLRPRDASLDLGVIFAAARLPNSVNVVRRGQSDALAPPTLGGGSSPCYNPANVSALATSVPAPRSHTVPGESFSSLLARAHVFIQANRFPEALALLEQAERIARRSGNESDLAKSLTRKALCLATMGRTSEAEQVGTEVDALIVRESHRQRDTASFASLMARAAILAKEDRNLEALEILESAEAIARRTGDEKGLVSVLTLKARSLGKLGRNEAADRAKHEAVILTLKQHRTFANAFEKQRKYADAEKEFREALRICETYFGVEHPETATCMDSLAANLRRQGLFHEALTVAKPALEVRLRLFGLFHHHTAHSLWNTGRLYTQLARYEEADDALGKSLVVREKLFDVDHPCVADSLDALASLRRQQGRFDEAVALGERCLKIREVKLGPDHPLTAAARHNLALSKERQPSLQGGESADAEGGCCEPDGEIPPVVVVDRRPRPRPQHTVGYWIVLIAVASIATAVLVWWRKPELIAGVSAAVAIGGFMIVIARYTGRTSQLDQFLKWLTDRLKTIGGSTKPVTRGEEKLGRPSDAARDRIDGQSRRSHLEADDAREYVDRCRRLKHETLDLDFVLSLSTSAADEVATHDGTLTLNGLKEFRSKLAKSLVSHRGRLELNGVRTLTTEAAANIRKHDGDLCFNGLDQLLPSVAEHFAYHKGTLELNGVRTMDEEAARHIIKHRGPVQLRNCTLISDETKRILRSAPQIEFPCRDASA